MTLLLTSCRLFEPSPFELRAFDQTDWLARVDRYQMLDDLGARHLHPGLTQGEVTDLLGPPDSTSPGVWFYSCGVLPNSWAIEPVVFQLRWSGDGLQSWLVAGG